MAQRLAYLEAVIGADVTQFRKGMRDIRNDVGLLSEATKGLSTVARTLTYSVSAPLAAIGSYAFDTAKDFDASMRNINAIAGFTEQELERLSDRVLDLGARNRSGAIASADSLYTVFSAGISDTESAFSAMETSILTAEAGLADLETTTEAIIATFLSFSKTGQDVDAQLDLISNSLTHMVNVGVGSMEEFANSIGNVVPTAAAVDMSIVELYGNMAYLTQRGLSAAKAATSLNAALTSLTKPTEAMDAAFAQLGVKGMEDLIQKSGGVNDSLVALIGTTDGTQVQLQALFNNIRGSRAINLFNLDIEKWTEYIEEFGRKADGATLRAWEQQFKSISFQMDLAKSSIIGMGIAIGEELFPFILPIISNITEFGLGVTKLDDSSLKFIVTIGVFAAALPPLIWGLTSLVSPLGILIAGLGLLGGYTFENLAGLDGVFTGIAESLFGAYDLTALGSILSIIARKLFPEDEASDLQAIADEKLSVNIDPSKIVTFTNEAGTDVSLYSIFETYFKDLGVIDPSVFWQKILYAVFPDYDGSGSVAIKPGETITVYFDGVDWKLLDGTVGTTGDEDLDKMIAQKLAREEGKYPRDPKGSQKSLFVIPDLTKEIAILGATLAGVVKSAWEWVANEGISIVSYSVGYVSGTMVTMLVTGIETAWAALLSIDTTDTSDKLTDNIVTPFEEGMDAAFSNLGRSDLADSLLAKLAAGLIASVIGAGLIKGALGTVISLAFSGLNFLTLGITGTLATKLAGAFTVAFGSANVIATVGAGAAGSITQAATTTGIVYTAGVSLGKVIGAAIGVGLNVVLPILIGAIVGKAIAEAILAAVPEEDKGFIGDSLLFGDSDYEPTTPFGALGKFAMEGVGDMLSPTHTYAGLPPEFNAQQIDPTNFWNNPLSGTIKYNIPGMESWYGDTGNAQADEEKNKIQDMYNELQNSDLSAQDYATGLTKIRDAINNIDDVANTQYFLDYVSMIENLGLEVDNFNNNKLKETLTILSYMGMGGVAGQEGFVAMQATVNQMLALSALIDSIEAKGIPVPEDLLSAVGIMEDGTLIFPMGVRYTDTPEGKVLRDEIVDFPLDTANNMLTMSSTSSIVFPIINKGLTLQGKKVDAVKEKWVSLNAEINKFLPPKSNTINFNRPDGFSSGLDYVPFDEFPAILHKGEMVLTANEADSYRKGEMALNVNSIEPTNRGGQGDGNIVINNIYINQLGSYEELFEEFDRRNIDLERYNRYEQ